MHRMPTNKILWPVASVLALSAIVAVFLPQHQAYGYGECTAPGNLAYAGVPGDRVYKVQLTWGDYDLSLCDEDLTTKAYDIQVKNSAGDIVRAKTRTRIDKFSLPPLGTKIRVKLLGYNKTLQFRVRAVANDGTTTAWSHYFEFTTPLQKPHVSVTKSGYDSAAHSIDGHVEWDALADQDFQWYRVKLTQYWYEAVGSNSYQLHTTTLLSKKITDNKTTSAAFQDVKEYLDKTQEQPYDQYYYEATVRGVYDLDGEDVKTPLTTKQFSVDSGGNLTTYFNPPSGNLLNAQLSTSH